MPRRRAAQPLLPELDPSASDPTPTASLEPSGVEIPEQHEDDNNDEGGEHGNDDVDEGGRDDAEQVDDNGQLDERALKMQQLRQRLNESQRANRKEVVAEAKRSQVSAQEAARLQRKKAQAIAVGEKAEAAAAGTDLERKRNWEYSVEDCEKWDKKQKKKKSRTDVGFTNYEDVARRKYKKDVDQLKPDMVAYDKQRALANSVDLLPNLDTKVIAGSSSTAITRERAAEDLYRDSTSFAYADHKPSEDAIDRVVSRLNQDKAKKQNFSRVRAEDDSDITYINAKNKHFNKKVARFYDKYTENIRDSFERGTAL